jgi:hypothetical protein
MSRWSDICSEDENKPLSPFKPPSSDASNAKESSHEQVENMESLGTDQCTHSQNQLLVQQRLRIPLDLLQTLSETRDKMFSLEPKVRKEKLLSNQSAIFKALEDIPDGNSVEEQALRFYIRGKALDVTSEDFVSEAEELLGRAVKLDPALGDCWNQLGASFWKKGDFQAAHDCWQCSLLHAGRASSARIALRELSMAHRSKGGNAEESLRLAKEAMSRDMRDTRSWYNLGTAYLSYFFAVSLDPEDLTRALRAYNKAAADTADANPDLHYNRC